MRMIGGALILFALSALLFTVPAMTPWVPIPFYMVLLVWTFSYASLVVLPLIYAAEFYLLSGKANFGKIVLTASLVLSALSILYFLASWEYGLKHQGELHTRIVAVENVVGFLALSSLSILGLLRASKTLQRAANLLLFVLLTWCAFPYLGELP